MLLNHQTERMSHKSHKIPSIMRKSNSHKPTSNIPTSTAAGQVRIIAGQWRRQQLPVLVHDGLRPTGDRVRETVFNWLNHFWGGQFAGRTVLDVFAGTGAFGLECISRGAREVILIDSHKPAVENIRKTLQHWGKHDGSIAQIKLIQDDALAVLTQLAGQKQTFDVIFLDPPFGHGWLERVVPLIRPLCGDDTLLYIETEKSADLSVLTQAGWHCVREGKTQQTQYGLWHLV